MITSALDDDLRSHNQQSIDALADQVIVGREDDREDAADELAHDRDETAEETYRYDDDQGLDEDTDLHLGLGY